VTTGRGPDALDAARALIGRRVHWNNGPQHRGTITDIANANGWVRYVIRWDAGTPAGWGTVLSPTVVVVEDT
jgi:hypothetical protein